MRGLAILFGFQIIGTLIARTMHLPLPGNVLGLMLFLIALFAGWIKLEWVERTSSFLLKHMMLFFTPFIVGTIVFFPLISREWIPILLSLLIGTFITILVTGLSAKYWTQAGTTELREKENSHGA